VKFQSEIKDLGEIRNAILIKVPASEESEAAFTATSISCALTTELFHCT
jgi:hypothetical protein